MDFELDETESPKTVLDLFPLEADDKFLKALREGVVSPDKVSFLVDHRQIGHAQHLTIKLSKLIVRLTAVPQLGK